MTATHQPFKEAALAYEAIRTFVRDNCPPDSPMSLTDIAKKLETHDHVKGIQQVRDAIKKYRTNNDFAAMREGPHLMVWWKGEAVKKPETRGRKPGYEPVRVIKPYATEETEVLNKTLEAPASDLPEVTITKSAIHSLAGGVKITIER